jgi:hypothetical protein
MFFLSYKSNEPYGKENDFFCMCGRWTSGHAIDHELELSKDDGAKARWYRSSAVRTVVCWTKQTSTLLRDLPFLAEMGFHARGGKSM